MSSVSKRKRECTKTKIKSFGDHKEFLKRITKTLYYGELPSLPCLSLPATELSCELWSAAQRGRSLRRLHADAAAQVARSACVSPCALVLAILYLERLNACNPDYLAATAPTDLFLVSLMVSNKFLQDDGADDEVVCAEWAASGGLTLQQLKKLEIEFLDAIDWKVYVSDESFEAGLSWLERQIALRQARTRGFFTYTDLANSCEHIQLAYALKCASSVWLALAVGYLTGLMAVMTSALVVAHTWLPTLQPSTPLAAAPSVSTTLPYPAATPTTATTLTPHLPNKTDAQDVLKDVINGTIGDEFMGVINGTTSDEFTLTVPSKCCSKWLQYRARTIEKVSWHDSIIMNDKYSFEPWWSRTSVLNWLYQISLINPLQRWLEKLNRASEFVNKDLIRYLHGTANYVNKNCDNTVNIYNGPKRCVCQWVNFRKFSALVVSVTDR